MAASRTWQYGEGGNTEEEAAGQGSQVGLSGSAEKVVARRSGSATFSPTIGAFGVGGCEELVCTEECGSVEKVAV